VLLLFLLLHAADVTASACVTPVASASAVADIAAVARVPLVHDVLTVAGHHGINSGVTGVVGVRSFLLLLSFQIFSKKINGISFCVLYINNLTIISNQTNK
jgi:hypothetical protein